MLALFRPFTLAAQSVVESLSEDNSVTEEVDLVTEKIEKFSNSKKIFIITNQNNVLGKGDFFSILLENQLVARGVVAKQVDNIVGIKILKIYSLQRFNRVLKKNMRIQILRGDDSYYNSKKMVAEKDDSAEKSTTKIESEDDLYSKSAVLEEDILLEEKSDRAIKTDNILGFSWGQYGATDMDGGSISFPHWGFNWGYQLLDNIFAEVFYGISTMSDYPTGGIDTDLTNIVLRLKYNIRAPFDSFLMPYVGYKITSVNSPGAGVDDGVSSQTDLDEEVRLVNELEERKPIFGVSVLKRMVPGWFAKADLGIDVVNIGIALEF